MLAATTFTPTKRPSPTPPPSPRPAPSPLQPPPPTENQVLTATLFASRPFDLVQGSQVQIGWKSTGPLYSVSLRLVRQSPVPAGIIVRWPDVLPETSTVTVAMPSNANVNQTVRLELWCTNSANPIFAIACFKSSSFVVFPVVAGLPTKITDLPGIATPPPPPPPPEPTKNDDEGSVSSFLSSTGAIIGLIALSLLLAVVFGGFFWEALPRETEGAPRIRLLRPNAPERPFPSALESAPDKESAFKAGHLPSYTNQQCPIAYCLVYRIKACHARSRVTVAGRNAL
ncbi:hypothetical protein MVEG_03164 [Podila verticillata NRRL 6337]|nr:hypothetical protein MVEG_03164 [Podila verticillata NRRL 6337]